MAISMALTDTKIKNAKPADKPYKLTDGRGLFPLIQPNGAKLWRFKYTFAGKEKLMAIGAYPDVPLKTARDLHQQARELLALGVDPMAQRQEVKAAQKASEEGSFAAVVRKWQEHYKAGVTQNHAEHVDRALTKYVLPAIGTKAINDITAPDLVEMIKDIEAKGAPVVARRALMTVGQVFRYGINHRLATRNPAAEIRPGEILKPHNVQNMPRVEERELPELIRAIDSYTGDEQTVLAIKLMALTFVRTKEMCGTRWEEIDFDAARWLVPKERMKKIKGSPRTPHIVPLSRQAVDVLRTLRAMNGDSEFVFPNQLYPVGHMGLRTMLNALYRMGYKGLMTTHGFRGVASTVLAEKSEFEEHHIEAQLSHLKRNKVAAAYNHAKYLPQRRALMQWWADYLDRVRQGAKVISIAS
jgi:integrase